jgi:hypothetical protein
MSITETTTPTVGMGATVRFWSDSVAGTIIAVSNDGQVIAVQRDTATRIDSNGMSERQHYEYEANPNGTIWQFSLRKNGRWVRVGEPMRNGLGCHINTRHEHYDFSF